jgi:hypothetical protein
VSAGFAPATIWTSSQHDRDTNAAKNILARGLVELEKEFSTAGEVRAVESAVNKVAQAAGAGHGPLVAEIIAPLGR